MVRKGGFAYHAAVDNNEKSSCEKWHCEKWRYAKWKDIAFAIWNLLFPRGCAGCDAPDCVLCEECCNALKCWKQASFSSVTCGYRYACGVYAESVRRSILLWKDHGDVACNKVFAKLLSDLVITVLNKLLISKPHNYTNSSKKQNFLYEENLKNNFHNPSNENPILVIPMPSSNASQRRRGRKHMLPLANKIAEDLCSSNIPACAANIVRMDSKINTKSVQTSGSRGRSRRASNAFKVDLKMLEKLNCGSSEYQAIIVDDIVTTGSTMSSCAAALRNANICTIAAFSLACVINVGDDTTDYE